MTNNRWMIVWKQNFQRGYYTNTTTWYTNRFKTLQQALEREKHFIQNQIEYKWVML